MRGKILNYFMVPTVDKTAPPTPIYCFVQSEILFTEESVLSLSFTPTVTYPWSVIAVKPLADYNSDFSSIFDHLNIKMGYKTEKAFDNILTDTENTRSGGGFGRKFVPTGKPGSGSGVRAGDRFRRGCVRTIMRPKHISRVTKVTKHSGVDVSSASRAWQHGLFNDFGQLIQDCTVSSTTKSPVTKEVKEDLTSVEPAMERIWQENNSSPAGGEGVGEGRKKSVKQEHEEFLAYIRNIRAKSKTLLHDVKQLRYDLRVYPF